MEHEEKKRIWSDFHDAVNTSPAELETGLATDDSESRHSLMNWGHDPLT